nr:hypothetical protein [Tanacetum cinerariifolium]
MMSNSETYLFEEEPHESERDPEDSSEEDPSEDEEEPLLAQITPTPPTQPTQTSSYDAYRTHPNGPLRIFTPRKRVRSTLSLSNIIIAATTEAIAFTPQKRAWLTPSLLDTTVAATSKAIVIPRWEWTHDMLCTWGIDEGLLRVTKAEESSLTVHTSTLTKEPIHQIVSLLVTHMARHKREIRSLQDQLNDHHLTK